MYDKSGPDYNLFFKKVEACVNKKNGWGIFSRDWLSGLATDIHTALMTVWGPGTNEEWRLQRELTDLTNELLIYAYEHRTDRHEGISNSVVIPNIYVQQVRNAHIALVRFQETQCAAE